MKAKEVKAWVEDVQERLQDKLGGGSPKTDAYLEAIYRMLVILATKDGK